MLKDVLTTESHCFQTLNIPTVRMGDGWLNCPTHWGQALEIGLQDLIMDEAHFMTRAGGCWWLCWKLQQIKPEIFDDQMFGRDASKHHFSLDIEPVDSM